jgi:mRNA-degrading endonuclease RelE of RelBE toxin-antitoxin system
MPSAITVLDSFLSSAYDLPKETTRKVFKALKNVVSDPRSPGLHVERLTGQASDLWSIRVDDDYRIILQFTEARPPAALFVGKHDLAYRFANRTGQLERGEPLFCREKPVGRAAVSHSADPHPTPESWSLPPTEDAAIIDIDDLASLVNTRKYLPLARVLLQEVASSLKFSFVAIELLLGDQLPPSARKHRPWWANERGRHVQASAWLGVGWKVDSVDLKAETVTFHRAGA